MRYRRVTGRGHLDLSIALNRSAKPLVIGNPDVVHLSGGPGGLLLLSRLAVPLVYTAHHTHRQSMRHPLRRIFVELERRAYLKASMVIAVSPTTASSVVSMGVPAERVRVVSPGIGPVEAGAAVERDPRRMLFVGRLHSAKGPLDAVEAMQRVCELLPGASGAVIGEGPLAPRVREAVGRTPGGRIVFLGRRSDSEVADELSRAAIVVMPSAFEGLGMVALEAMASGAVVAGYDVEGLRDTVGAHGVLVQAGDVRELASVCGQLLGDEQRRGQLAEAGALAVARERSWSRCAEAVEAVYREVLETSPR
jgi:glycosyltransferase involved in cell wall biosynthesis